MALEKAAGNDVFKLHSREEYEAKKKQIFASVDGNRERVWNGMIYCRFCNGAKVADFPERNFIVKCICECEAEKWEARRRNWNRNSIFAKELRAGDFNPFD